MSHHQRRPVHSCKSEASDEIGVTICIQSLINKNNMRLGWHNSPHTVLCCLVAVQHRNLWDPGESTGASLDSLLRSQANLVKGVRVMDCRDARVKFWLVQGPGSVRYASVIAEGSQMALRPTLGWTHRQA